MRFDRCKRLFDNFDELQQLQILICGLGGVGGYALDCLYKSGICNITAIDYDIFEIHNQNRQIGSEYVHEKKTAVFQKLYPNIHTIDVKITPQWLEEFDIGQFDIVIDAIDDIPAKIALIKKAYPNIISSMGAAKRIDPTKIEITTLNKTYNDPFAKVIRQKLKNYKKLQVVFSSEIPRCKEMGSFIGVTASFGMALCSRVIQLYGK
ncbi:MAG: tRNA threonylcarbamoyladenosine dehydratase [Epsilonproteobacteria bacterium]|nr:tRNA threonylcarbamoyladenosine dehydratase [Campylobacterota bacterium]